MAWKSRQGRRYYYRSEWRDGRSHTVYVGHGPEAEAQARHAAVKREQRQARRADWLAAEAQVAAADLLLNELTTWCSLLATATMLLAGHHQHHGIWRRRIFFT